MKIIGFFNNKGGVGKTTLAYHIAWMFRDLGVRVLVADFDPQANLTVAMLDDDRLLALDAEGTDKTKTIYDAIEPILEGSGDVAPLRGEEIDEDLWLIPGDLGLARFEDRLSDAWPRCIDDDRAALRATTALYRTVRVAGDARGVDLALVDVGPNIGAINRSALISCDFIVVPLTADIFSLRGLRNLGPVLRSWREDWGERRERAERLALKFDLPLGAMNPIGYVLHQHAVRSDRPTLAYDRWANRVPRQYAESVLGTKPADASEDLDSDANALAVLKHYRSLMAMAQQARKPVFKLRAADGAIGGHVDAVRKARGDFETLTRRIAQAAGVKL